MTEQPTITINTTESNAQRLAVLIDTNEFHCPKIGRKPVSHECLQYNMNHLPNDWHMIALHYAGQELNTLRVVIIEYHGDKRKKIDYNTIIEQVQARRFHPIKDGEAIKFVPIEDLQPAAPATPAAAKPMTTREKLAANRKRQAELEAKRI